MYIPQKSESEQQSFFEAAYEKTLQIAIARIQQHHAARHLQAQRNWSSAISGLVLNTISSGT